jgi:hypothetical protein
VRTARLIVLVILAACWPSTAHAGLGWLSWLEELSGPGPFHGIMFTSAIACAPAQGPLDFCSVASEQMVHTIAIRVGRLTSGKDALRFRDLPASDPGNTDPVNVVPITVLYLHRVHRAVEIGAGAGVMRTSGTGFDAFWKFSLTPTAVAFTPGALKKTWTREWARRVAHAARLEFDTSYFPQGFDGSDFNNPRTTFKSKPEILTRAGLVIDVGELLGWGYAR